MNLSSSQHTPGTDFGIFRLQQPADPKPMPKESIFRVAGLDLGQTTDHAAASILDRRMYTDGFCGPHDQRVVLKSIRRWPNGTDYTDVLAQALGIPELDVLVVEYNGVGRPVIDIARRMIRKGDVEFKGRLIPVTSVNSRSRLHEVSEAGGKKSWSVPKIDLVSSIQLLIQAANRWYAGIVTGNIRRTVGPFRTDKEAAKYAKAHGTVEWIDRDGQGMVIPRRLEGVKDLFEEVRIFQIKYTKSANLQFGNEPGAGKHDDIVISLGLAAWWMKNARKLALWSPD